MNYGKAKKILIFLFLFINLGLIYLLVGISGDNNELSLDSANKVIALAKQKNISVEQSALPKRVEMLDFLELESVSDFKIQDATSVASGKPDDILKTLKKQDFLSDYSLEFLNKDTNLITDEVRYQFTQSYNGYTLYGSELYAVVEKNSITNVSGTLFNLKSVKYSDFEMISPLQILLDISANYSGNGEKISSLKQAYYISPDSLEFKNLTAIPCYVIDLSKGKMFYDAVNGDFLMYLGSNGSKLFDKTEAYSSI